MGNKHSYIVLMILISVTANYPSFIVLMQFFKVDILI